MSEITELKARIKRASQELFMQYGIRSISMDNIAAAIGSSKKTIYQYYADKDSLVLDIVSSMLKANIQICETRKAAAENAIHEGFLAIDITTELFSRMNPMLVNDLHKYHPRAYKKFSDYKNDYLYGALKANIERGIAEGYFRDDIQVDVLARFRVESVMIPFFPDYYNRISSSLADIHKALFYLFLYGISTPVGYKLITKYKQQKNKTTPHAKG